MTYQNLWQRIAPLYGEREAQAIVRLVLEEKLGLSLTDIYTSKVNELSGEQTEELKKIMQRLEKSEPVQYVLGYATFKGRAFKVSPNVLIPRPETECLCQWIESEHNGAYCALQPPIPLEVLDIGTGSGCIAVTLSLAIDNVHLSAWDISGDALLVARENMHHWGVTIDLQMEDALQPSEEAMLKQFDVIVSNPPYICDKERTEMDDNVLKYEPHTALFVPNDDPLLFYRAIASYGMKALRREGSLFFETNPLYINAIAEMLEKMGYGRIGMKNDQFGKLRFIKATRL